MKYRKCDFCKCEIKEGNGFIITKYDLCVPCGLLARRGTCKECKGIGKIQVVDKRATHAQSSCGESRTQYKSIECEQCS